MIIPRANVQLGDGIRHSGGGGHKRLPLLAGFLCLVVVSAASALVGGVVVVAGDDETPLSADAPRWYQARETFLDLSGEEQELAFLGDVRVVVGEAEVLADAAVVWLGPRSEMEPDEVPIRALYAEGRVHVSGGGSILEAERILWDVRGRVARVWSTRVAVSGGKLGSLVQEGGGAGPYDAAGSLVLRAADMRLDGVRAQKSALNLGTLSASGLLVTTCSFGVPHWALQAAWARVAPSEASADGAEARGLSATPGEPGREGAAPIAGSDRAAALAGAGAEAGGRLGDLGHWTIEAKDLELQVLEVPVLWLPGFYWDTRWNPYLPRIRAGSSSEFGEFVLAELRVPAPLVETPVGEVRPRVALEADFYGKRGPAGGVDLRLGGESFGSLVDSYYVRDRGDDVSGVDNPHSDRSRLAMLHRQDWVSLGLHLDAELHYISDDGLLDEFFEREAKEDKPPETYLHLRWAADHHAAQATARWRFNRFDSDDQGGGVFVEQLPRLLYQLMPWPIWEEPLTDGAVLLSGRVELANLRRREQVIGGDFSDRSSRADALAEVIYANTFGPIRLTGGVGGRLTLYERPLVEVNGVDRLVQVGGVTQLNEADDGFAVDGLARHVTFAGFALSTDFWRVFAFEQGSWHRSGLRHVVTPTVGYDNTFVVSEAAEDLIDFDAVDRLRESESVFVSLRNRLQVRRNDGVLDLVDLDLTGRWFPHPGRELGRRQAGVLTADLRLRPATWLSGRLRARWDPEGGGMQRADSSVFVALGERFWAVASHSFVDDRSSALGLDLVAHLSARWSVRVSEQYDFEAEEFLRHRLTLRRRLHAFIIDLNLSVDPGEDDVAVSVSFRPDWLNRRRDAFDSDGRLRELSY